MTRVVAGHHFLVPQWARPTLSEASQGHTTGPIWGSLIGFGAIISDPPPPSGPLPPPCPTPSMRIQHNVPFAAPKPKPRPPRSSSRMLPLSSDNPIPKQPTDYKAQVDAMMVKRSGLLRVVSSRGCFALPVERPGPHRSGTRHRLFSEGGTSVASFFMANVPRGPWAPYGSGRLLRGAQYGTCLAAGRYALPLLFFWV